uniref:DNA-directed RNA polymerase subunit n=1 Tax=Watanabea reniformis TaxID=191674 RepID=A0A097KK88_9CHLO|nr:beta' subunit of RNA polymerase [Watanabea reniformis]AIT93605.1 beta' subunit of RNA polymerase [Watanabea reniformis]
MGMLNSRDKRELKINQRRILMDSIELGIPSPEQIRSWGERRLPNGRLVGEVKNSKTVNYKKFTSLRDGLFCERIFGPVENFVCACGKRQPRIDVKFCEKCEVEYTTNHTRRYRLGYIQLVSAATHIWFLKGRPSYLSLFLGKRKKRVVAVAYCNGYLVEQGFPNIKNLSSSFTRRHHGTAIYEGDNLNIVKSTVEIKKTTQLSGNSHYPNPNEFTSPLESEKGLYRERMNPSAPYQDSNGSTFSFIKTPRPSLPPKLVASPHHQRCSPMATPGEHLTFKEKENTTLPEVGASNESQKPEKRFHLVKEQVKNKGNTLLQRHEVLTQRGRIHLDNSYNFAKRPPFEDAPSTSPPEVVGVRLWRSPKVKAKAQFRVASSYAQAQTLPFLPTLVCRYNLRDELIDYLNSYPFKEDIPLPLYCGETRWRSLRDIHNFMAEQPLRGLKQSSENETLQAETPHNLNDAQVNLEKNFHARPYDKPTSLKTINDTNKEDWIDFNSMNLDINEAVKNGKPESMEREGDGKHRFPKTGSIQADKRVLYKSFSHLPRMYALRSTPSKELPTLSLSLQETLGQRHEVLTRRGRIPFSKLKATTKTEEETQDSGNINNVHAFQSTPLLSSPQTSLGSKQGLSSFPSENLPEGRKQGGEMISLSPPPKVESSPLGRRSSSVEGINKGEAASSLVDTKGVPSVEGDRTSFGGRRRLPPKLVGADGAQIALLKEPFEAHENTQNASTFSLLTHNHQPPLVDRWKPQANKKGRGKEVENLPSIELTAIREILSYTGGGALQHLLKRYNTHSFATFLLSDLQDARLAYQDMIKEVGDWPKRRERKILNRFCRRIYRTGRRLKIVQLFLRNQRRPEWMILSAVPVLPPDLRPILQMSETLVVASDLNNLYQRVIYRNNRYHKLRFIDFNLVTAIQRLVQDAVDRLIENGKGGSKPFYTPGGRPLKSLSDTLKGKKGRFRLNLLGKRVDFSGRSVIVVAPHLKINECGLPREMALELFHYFLVRQFMLKKRGSTIVMAKMAIKQRSQGMWDMLRDLIYHHPVLLNRAPTLHRLGIQAFQPRLVLGSAILLHPLVCSGFNADFDGDQMGVHLPLCFQARAEAWDLLWSRNNLLSPATGQPMLVPSQDMVLGFYYMTTLPAYKKPDPKSFQTLDPPNRVLHLLESQQKNQRQSRPPLVFAEGVAIQTSGESAESYTTGRKERAQIKRRMLFQDSHDVITAFHQGHIRLHTPLWLKCEATLENNGDIETPLELQLNSFGGVTQIYAKHMCEIDLATFSTTLLARTSVGRVMVNYVISPYTAPL